ncbi:S41 family peptidase [Namhaeicola litoreus]|uniref:Tricorn protease homolog n=1 Tax=Namhaeicola litoreus TaxID=1052145 RepID=A0ABW3Y1W9_9FLAO
MKHFYSILFCLSVVSFVFSQNSLIQNPSLNYDGTKIAFGLYGDIWVSDLAGNDLKRLTVHESYDGNPLWSEDGSLIAFQSDRYDNEDIFVVSSEGGVPKRLTFHSANDLITDFVGNEIIFNSSRNNVRVEREPQIQTLPIAGGTPVDRINSLGFDAVLSPDKSMIAFVKGHCRIEREAYRGSANRDIWIYHFKNNTYKKLTDFQGNDFHPQWADNSTIYYQSSESGKYNVRKLKIDANGNKVGGSELITDFQDMGIFSFDLSGNGKKIILTKGDEVWLIDPISKNKQQVKTEIQGDFTSYPIERKSVSGDIEELAVSPNGDYTAFVHRGEIFITENDKDKSRAINVTQSAYRDRMPFWLNDEVLIYVSDVSGNNEIYALSSDDAGEKNLFKTLKRKKKQLTNTAEEEGDPIISPDKKRIAFIRGNGKLVVANISSVGQISNELVLLDGWSKPSGLSWSPDSNWIAYSADNLDFNEEIFIQKIAPDSKPINVSFHPKNDMLPIWSNDGSKLGFTSNRNNGDFDVWFIWLKKEDWERTKEDWEEMESTDDNADDDKESKDKAETVMPLQIDLEKIHERKEQVTGFAGGEFLRAISQDGKKFYYNSENGTRGNIKIDSDLFEIKWDGKDKKELTSGDKEPRNVKVNDKYTYLFYTSKGKLNSLKLKDQKSESLPVSGYMDINYILETDQIFEEAWSAINHSFYDPDFHGQDWNRLKEVYKALAMKASTRRDFMQVFNRMLGQINASHMGMYREEERTDLQKDLTGKLGITVRQLENGTVKVEKVTDLMPADKTTSKLFVGDIITHVNGIELVSGKNFYELFNHLDNQKIYLDVIGKNGKREVVIRPTSSDRDEKYLDWVNERKRLTDNYSNGKLGYIHIQGMNWESFEVFEQELAVAGEGKEGIVIDVRYNGGGWTTDYLMAVLNVKQHAYTIPRGAAENVKKDHQKFRDHYPFHERLPLSSWTKPSVAICNQASYSNAEIFSHAYKSLDLGDLVGVPTFGAVISTGGRTLIDGSYVRIPFRGWFVKESGGNMEYTPAVPDIIVEDFPDSQAKGDDPQLRKAVDSLLGKIGKP